MAKAKSEIRLLAEKIAADLFTYSMKRADRLVLEMPGQRLGGPGWCQRAVADVAEKWLKNAAKRKRKVPQAAALEGRTP